MVTAIQPPFEMQRWFKELVRRDGSDLFLFPGEPPALRLGGALERAEEEPLSVEDVRKLAVAAFGEEELKRIGKDAAAVRGICSLDLPDGTQTVRFMVVAGRSGGDYTLSARLLPYRVLSLAQAALPETVTRAAELRSGLVVFSGMVGSGVMTSAATFVEHINASRKAQLCVIGDPVEYMFEGKQCLVQHKEVGIDVPDAVSGIAAAIQQDADVLFITEICRAEELEACLTVAQQALVIVVVHALSPEAAMERMILAFPPDLQDTARKGIANALRCVVNQRLLPRAGGKGRVAAYGVFAPDRETCRRVLEIPHLSSAGFARNEGEAPVGYESVTDCVKRLLSEGRIDAETAEKTLSEL